MSAGRGDPYRGATSQRTQRRRAISIDTCTAARTVSTVTTADGTEIVPIDAAGRASARLVKGAVLEVHPGAPHGIADTHKDRLNGNLLRFLRGGRGAIG